ncbi:MAG: isoprenyl transferase [Deferribacteraceae bacterium]|jgi:undecaprenyl diphosphate synthase|nr:isoprenyl transferase [Deferribacteraceae bacterium]
MSLSENIPRHVALIMDRNGEWAKKRGIDRTMGHREGVRVIQRILNAAEDAGVKFLSLFAFSTENWLRPKNEVSFLMRLLEEYLKKEAQELIKRDVKLIISGETNRIPESARRMLADLVGKSSANAGIVLNIALDFGGRAEITAAALRIAEDVKRGIVTPEDITEKLFEKYLYCPELPDVDLLIRTGGELRISNFMLWRLAYAEFYFTPVLWPDFSAEDFKKALEEFARRKRRFGMTDEQIENI